MYTSYQVDRILRLAVRAARANQTETKIPLQIVSVVTAKTSLETYSGHVGWAHGFFSGPSYNVRFPHTFEEANPDLTAATEMLEAADLLLIPGGNTEALIAYWEATGLAKLMRTAIERGVVVFGHSAGLLCLFSVSNTDADSYTQPEGTPFQYRMVRGLGALNTNVACCPHAADVAKEYTHNEPFYGNKTRRQDFVEWLKRSGSNGIAVDGDTAIVVKGDLVKVTGSGRVTTHVWVGGALLTAEYRERGSFTLSSLNR